MPHIAGTRSVSVRKSIEGTTAENPLPMILIYDFYLVEPEPSAHKIVGAEKEQWLVKYRRQYSALEKYRASRLVPGCIRILQVRSKHRVE